MSKSLINLLKIAEINVTELCNRTCSFCPRSTFYPNKNLHISTELVDLFCKQLKEVNFNEWFAFCGKGEPLLHPNIVELTKIVKSYGFKSRLFTNGDRLDKFVNNLNVDEIWVSFYDSPSEFTEYKKQFKKYNHIFYSNKYDDGNFNSEKAKGTRFSNRAGSFWQEKSNLPCHYQFIKVLIDWNGDVNFCVHDWKYRLSVDNIQRNHIKEIWENNPLFVLARQELPKGNRSCITPCSECSMSFSERGRSEYEEWLELNDQPK